MIRIRKTRREDLPIYARALALTVAVTCTVVGLMILVYPQEAWAREIPFAIGMCIAMTFPITTILLRKIRENARLAREMKRLVDRDRLTDTATRDFFFARLEDSDDVYGVSLMLDIDHFKRVNDRFGHLAGDDVIRAVAGILLRNCRQEDLVCRFGGEEFAVFLFDAGPREGELVAERMRRQVEDLVVGAAGQDISVTVSVGGSLKQRSDEIMDALREADGALYKAKQRGRNRCVMAWSPQAQIEAVVVA